MMTREEFYATYEDANSMSPFDWYEVGYKQGEYDVDEWVSKCADLARENAALKVKLELAETRLNKYKRLSRHKD